MKKPTDPKLKRGAFYKYGLQDNKGHENFIIPGQLRDLWSKEVGLSYDEDIAKNLKAVRIS